ncbi:MAG TPA: HAD-IIIA family hydrolase [Rhizomicrobium sp.]|jgi:D-glycero-D-manno-heptose 1,7-bisphosphate phosphatase
MRAPDQCAILIGGLGRRLGDLTRSLPKPLLPVGERPFLDHIISEAARFGFKDILLLAGHCHEAVRRYLTEREGSWHRGPAITLRVELTPAGTGGALWEARDCLQSHFLLLNGDTWFDFNWLALGQVEGSSWATATIALRTLCEPGRYGIVTLRGSVVERFGGGHEAAGPGYVNGGVYLMSRDVVGHLRPKCSLEQDVFPELAAAGKLRAGAFSGRFLDIGVPEDLCEAQASIPLWARRPAVFLDRDGTLNVDTGYVHSPGEFHWLPGAIDAVKALNDAGVYVFVVTNQAGVAHGMYEEADVVALHDWMQAELRDRGAHIDDFRYCPYHPDAVAESYRRDHAWRKPKAGMLEDLMRRWPIDLQKSIIVGDKDSDVEAGRLVGVPGVMLERENLYGVVSAFLDLLKRESDPVCPQAVSGQSV